MHCSRATSRASRARGSSSSGGSGGVCWSLRAWASLRQASSHTKRATLRKYGMGVAQLQGLPLGELAGHPVEHHVPQAGRVPGPLVAKNASKPLSDPLIGGPLGRGLRGQRAQEAGPGLGRQRHDCPLRHPEGDLYHELHAMRGATLDVNATSGHQSPMRARVLLWLLGLALLAACRADRPRSGPRRPSPRAPRAWRRGTGPGSPRPGPASPRPAAWRRRPSARTC
jgi:hypothetical protein